MDETRLMNASMAAFFTVLVLSVNTSAATPGNNYLVVWGVQTTPDVIYSGDDFTLSFQIYNAWDHDVEDAYVQIQGAYPLMQLSPARVKHVDTIESSYASPLERMYFGLHVDENAVAGTYPLTVTVTYRTREVATGLRGLTTKDVTYTESSSVSVVVKGKPKIGVSSSVKPEKIQPDSIISLTLKVSNEGTDTAKDVQISFEDTPKLKLLGTSRSVYVGDVEPKASSTVTVQMEADKNAEAGAAEVSANVDYKDKNNTQYSNAFQTPVIISVDYPDIDLSVINSQPSKIRPGDNAAITLKIWNKGEGNARNVRVQASSVYPFTVAWANRDLILGDIPANGFSTTSIQVEVKKNATASSKWSLHIALSYDNVNERKHFNSTETLEISLEEAVDFTVYATESQIKPDGKWMPVTFQIKNTGTAAAKEVKVNLNTQYPITPTGKQQYFDELNPGETINATFHVDVDSQAVPQTYPIDLYIQWKEGSLDTQYTTTKSSSIPVEAAESNTKLIAAAAVILVTAVVIVMRRKASTANRNKKKEGENNE